MRKETIPGATGPASVDVAQGILVGLAAGALVGTLRWLHSAGAVWVSTWATRAAQGLFSASEGALPFAVGSAWGPLIWMAAFIGVALLVGQILRCFPHIGGSGIPYVEGVLRGHWVMRWQSTLCTKFAGVLPVLLGGLAIGREGPCIQISAAAGAGLGLLWGQRQETDAPAIVSGAAAGLAAAFGAPLAGVVFVFEEMRRPLAARTAVHCLAATFTACLVVEHIFHFGQVLPFVPFDGLLFRLVSAWGAGNGESEQVLASLCAMFVLGLLCGLGGAVYNGLLLRLKKLFSFLPLWLRPVAGFVPASLIFLFFPILLGGGEALMLGMAVPDATASSVLPGLPLWSALCLLLLGKTVFALLSFCCGVPGGLLMPLLCLGALLGAAVGAGAAHVGDAALFLPASNAAIVGMAGAFGGIVRAPLTGVLLCAEMTHAWTSVPDMLLVAMLAVAVANGLKSEPVYVSLGRQ